MLKQLRRLGRRAVAAFAVCGWARVAVELAASLSTFNGSIKRVELCSGAGNSLVLSHYHVKLIVVSVSQRRRRRAALKRSAITH